MLRQMLDLQFVNLIPVVGLVVGRRLKYGVADSYEGVQRLFPWIMAKETSEHVVAGVLHQLDPVVRVHCPSMFEDLHCLGR